MSSEGESVAVPRAEDLPSAPPVSRPPAPPPARAPALNTVDEQVAVAALRTGEARFMGLPLRVGRGALVPREETELLARAALDALAGCGPAPRVVDMCCGVGNLAVAVAHGVPGARVWAADLTDPCVALARANAAALGLEARVTVVQGDLFAALAGLSLEGTLDVLVCNPPYISSSRLARERAALLENEPREAFDAGPYGLSIHQRVIAGAPAFVRPGGTMLCEFGAGQSRQVALLFERTRAYGPVRFACDAAGEPRVAIARRV